MANLSPMLSQYLSIKENNKDSILMFRVGDFYEMFFDDAKTASRELELVLTGKDCGLDERAPMCGVPYHSCEGYIARLISKGYKVAICDQVEDPAAAKGLVRREVTRVITPGTVVEGSMLDEGRNNYLASVFVDEARAGLCFVDASTGELKITTVAGEDIAAMVCAELGKFSPREVILSESAAREKELCAFVTEKLSALCVVNKTEFFDRDSALGEINRHFGVSGPEELNINESDPTVAALGAVLSYLRETQKTVPDSIDTVTVYSGAQFMRLDPSTRKNLELCESMNSGEKRGSLLWVLDKTRTAMGKRLIRSWLLQPLVNHAAIIRRQNAVEELYCSSILRDDLSEVLGGIYDIERVMTRIVYGTATARELITLSAAFKKIPLLKSALGKVSSAYLADICERLDPIEEISSLIDAAIVESPPATVREGGMIRAGYSAELDDISSDMNGGKNIIARIEAQEKERTGIAKLRVGYNRVFGYYIEISNSYKALVPEEYIRKQTLTNCERYITEELKELEKRVITAQDRAVKLEYEIFTDICAKIGGFHRRAQTTAQAVAELDALYSLATVAAENNYCRPQIELDGIISVTEGRHPVVEKMLKGVPFVPNDVLLDNNDNRMCIVTGPNMAGKSTYMRQVAVITVMAQMGGFVPADSARIGIVDAVFTRVGASDDLSAGRSTFMVEMSEVANILNSATAKSLLILDEIGRGTSTFDGMSIARAVIEHIADKSKLGAKTVFATHYHELTELENSIDGVKNYNILVKKRGDDIVFLRRIVRGAADDSYGIEVAKLAGVPDSVLRRARSILKELTCGDPTTAMRNGAGKRTDARQNDDQLVLCNAQTDEIIEKLRRMDVNTMSPLEALSALYELTDRVGKI